MMSVCRRMQVRGVRHVIFYALPQYPQFYPEIANFTAEMKTVAQTQGSPACTVLFTKYEQMALERIVGKKRCAHILASKKSTFMFK